MTDNDIILQIMEKQVYLEPLDADLYTRLGNLPIMASVPLSLSDISEAVYMCGILPTKAGSTGGIIVFRVEESSADLVYIKLSPELCGRDYGRALFEKTAGILRTNGIQKITRSSPLSPEAEDYLIHLGFTSEVKSCYMEYDYETLIKSPLFSKLEQLAGFIARVHPGKDVSDTSKALFISELRRRRKQVIPGVLFGEHSAFYMNGNRICAYMGVVRESASRILIMDKGFVEETRDGVDVRVPLLAYLLDNVNRFVSDKRDFKMIFMIDDRKIEKGMCMSFGLPAVQNNLCTYVYML